MNDIIIVVIASLIGSLIKDLHQTVNEKELKMNFKKIIISWFFSTILSLFLINYYDDIFNNTALVFTLASMLGIFGYMLFEFTISSKGKNLILKVFFKKIGESIDIINDELEDKEN